MRAWGGHGASRFEEADVTPGHASFEHGGLGQFFNSYFVGIIIIVLHKYFGRLFHLMKKLIRYKNKGNIQQQGSTQADTLASSVVKEPARARILGQKPSTSGFRESFTDSETSSTLSASMTRTYTSSSDGEKNLKSRHLSFESVGSISSTKSQGEKTLNLSKHYSSRYFFSRIEKKFCFFSPSLYRPRSQFDIYLYLYIRIILEFYLLQKCGRAG